MTADTTQPAGALPEPEPLWAHPGIPDIRIFGYTADQMRALMAERDAARAGLASHMETAGMYRAERNLAQEEGASWRRVAERLEGEAAALRRELEELRAIPPDAREGREPLTDEQIEPLFRKVRAMEAVGVKDEWFWFAWGVEVAERAHRIGPAGTSADGETQP